MSDKPGGKRWRWQHWAWIVVVPFVAYMGAYFATATPRSGVIVGDMPPHYIIGQWHIPPTIAEPFFAPADWIARVSPRKLHRWRD